MFEDSQQTQLIIPEVPEAKSTDMEESEAKQDAEPTVERQEPATVEDEATAKLIAIPNETDEITWLEAKFPDRSVIVNSKGTITLKKKGRDQRSHSYTKNENKDVMSIKDAVKEQLQARYGDKIRLARANSPKTHIFQFRPSYCAFQVHLELGQWPRTRELSIDFHLEEKKGAKGKKFDKREASNLIHSFSEYAKENGFDTRVYNDDDKHLFPRVSLTRIHPGDSEVFTNLCAAFDALDQFLGQGTVYHQVVDRVYS